MRTPSPAPPSFLSIFSGCGGFDLGFIQAGYRCIGAFDRDPAAVAVHRENFGSTAGVLDLNEPLPHEIASSRPDVLLAGPPCQGFSTIGARRLDDPRNHLLLRVGQIALDLQPRVVAVENVKGVTAGQHRRFWDGLASLLRSGGYSVAETVVRCEQHGVAQQRSRILMLGWRGKPEVTFQLPIVQAVSLQSALSGLQGQPNHEPVALPAGSMGALIAKRIPQGSKLSNVRGGPRSVHTWDIPEVFGRVSDAERELLVTLMRERRRNRQRDYGDADPVSLATLAAAHGPRTATLLESLIAKGYVKSKGELFDLTHTFNGKYHRLSWQRPSPTVDTKFWEPRFFLHPDEHRGFTVREAARLQGFPDTFRFAGSTPQQFRMVGNAVPPPVGNLLANWIHAALLA